MQLVNYLVLGL